MSAATAIHEQHAATKQRLTVARDEAALRLSAHEHATKTKASELAEIEAAYVANATAEALGEPTQELPDANVLEKLRADAAVAEPVRRQLAANLEQCENALRVAESKHKAAIGDHLRETAMAPALNELQKAFDGLRDAAVNVMAAHHLAYRKFDDRAPTPNNALELYGPASEWLFTLNRMDWPYYPYEIRPAWLPRHGAFWPDELPGVADRVAALLAEVEQVPE
jgi:hypothetical protein